MSFLVVAASVTMLASIGTVSAWYVWYFGPPPALVHGLNDFRFQLQSSAIYAVPLRIFIGLGWLRASVEKAIEEDWWSGEALTAFLSSHQSQDRIVFPVYEALVGSIFLPAAAVLAVVIILGQFFVGLGIFSGTYTTAALFGGIFMNLNFLFIGEPNPSTFYIVIQIALLVTGAGSVISVDRILSRTQARGWLVSQPAPALRTNNRLHYVGLALALATAFYALLYVRDTSPAGSVDDPAMILTILALLSAAWLTISIARSRVEYARYRALPGTDGASGTAAGWRG